MAALNELAAHLATAGHGTVGTNLILGLLPEDPNVCRSIVPTGGDPDRRVFGGVLYEVYRFQLFIRDTAFAAGYSRALGMKATIDAIANLSITAGGATGWYLMAKALQPPYLLERDGQQRIVFSFNAEVWRTPIS